MPKINDLNKFSVPENRYERWECLREGGTSAIYRAFDRKMKHHLVMKILKIDLVEESQARSAFLNEANLLYRMQHPNIVGVFDVGELETGQIFMTMQELKGLSLAKLIQNGKIRDNLAILLKAFCSICSAVFYVHNQGYLHRDLKPENIILTENFDCVSLVGWGYALRIEPGEESIVGTPLYMSPEQARGELLDQRSDVYSLGTILFELLDGRKHIEIESFSKLLHSIGTDPHPKFTSEGNIPHSLAEIVDCAIQFHKEDRFSSVHDLELEIRNWFQIEERHAKGQRLVLIADEILEQSENMFQAAKELLSGVIWDQLENEEETVKYESWLVQDKAKDMFFEANQLRATYIHRIEEALLIEPSLLSARERLAEFYQQKLREIDISQRPFHIQETVLQLEGQIELLPVDNVVRQHSLDLIQGRGQLSIDCDSIEGKVVVEKYTLRKRRLQLELIEHVDLPLVGLPLEMGSYRLTIQCSGSEDALYPVWIDRKHHWDMGVESTIHLHKEGEIEDDWCYIPSGPVFRLNEGFDLKHSKHMVWVASYLIQKYPITNREYLVFLNDLVSSGQANFAEDYCPYPLKTPADELLCRYQQNDKDVYYLSHPKATDWPVTMINLNCVQAYSKWFSAQTGRSWRLPNALEWEKAAGGVDGRKYPWGDFFDPSWSCVQESSGLLPCSWEAFLVDESVYGVRHTAGLVSEWTSTKKRASDENVIKGSSWCSANYLSKIEIRNYRCGSLRNSDVGFRLVSSVHPSQS